MATVAEQLRTAREARKLTVNEVADTTKIRTDHIRALEAGDFNVFTAPVYIRGFVRTYATLLKLDVPEVMGTLDKELGQTEKFSEPPPLSTERRGPLDFIMLQLTKVDWRKGVAVLSAAVILSILFIVIWLVRRHHAANPLSGLTPAVYKPARSGETLPLTNP